MSTVTCYYRKQQEFGEKQTNTCLTDWKRVKTTPKLQILDQFHTKAPFYNSLHKIKFVGHWPLHIWLFLIIFDRKVSKNAINQHSDHEFLMYRLINIVNWLDWYSVRLDKWNIPINAIQLHVCCLIVEAYLHYMGFLMANAFVQWRRHT